MAKERGKKSPNGFTPSQLPEGKEDRLSGDCIAVKEKTQKGKSKADERQDPKSLCTRGHSHWLTSFVEDG